MKNTLKIYGLRVVLAVLIGFTGQAHTPDNRTTHENKADTCPAMIGDNLVGGWSYTAEGAPAEYGKGLLVIVKEGDSYKVQVQAAGGTLMGENVKVKGNTIDFEVLVDGDRVSVNLTAKGDKISGNSTSSEGSYNINGEKTLSMD